MKLRIRGNSLRLRLSRSEVREIGEGRPVRDELSFGGGMRLGYRLEPAPSERMSARFAEGEIRVALPAASAKAWAQSEQISIEGEQNIGDRDRLFILVEKDFFCRNPRSFPEDESDLFPHPSGSACSAPHDSGIR